ncbi:hypothetical protein N7468_008006 [Penicillium chermesinum]|uniref:SH3 domain-containing protein n=1 Tax=Penicillium chermesinum TaxID=63820 RepID=A0A9W9NRW2_9EURO|nr:uncharacterized protein N7468_008006 [Penicillium chermesinum]KAJ5223464.1 hypothetical protein N7468_008006 [Penicillium chermesinum]
MQSMQRKFGRLTTKRTADDSQVSVLLKDFEDADLLLGKIVESTKAWKDAWVSIATLQSRMVDEFDGLYAPILGSSEPTSARQPVETDPLLLARTNRMRKEFDELRDDITEELSVVDDRMIRPAVSAKDFIAPLKKTIKKRNDKKTDFERCQSRVDGLNQKLKRNDRDNAALVKAEAELATTKDVYRAADDDLRNRLPTLISLVFSLAPFILHAQIEIQNRMLAHYYTVLHTYCEEEGFPSPPPSMDQIVYDWEIAHQPISDRIESMGCLTQGKAIRQVQQNQQKPKRPSLGERSNTIASTPSNVRTAPPPFGMPKPPFAADTRPASPSSSYLTPRGSISVASSASSSHLPYGGDFYTPPPEVTPRVGSEPEQPASKPLRPTGLTTFAPAGPNVDHFRLTHQHSAPVVPTVDPLFAAAVSKPRPPPPPPPRPATVQYVTALYDFDGQNQGDLVFREGDRIKVLTKTDSTDDWWDGELRGVKGAFPANYVE